MSILSTFILCSTMIATAFLSGIFGMAGGMVLLGVLLAFLSLPVAMTLHAITQLTSNGTRALLWHKHIEWRSVGWFIFGAIIAFLIWAFIRYVPSKGLTLILLGSTPFLIKLIPKSFKPNPLNPLHSLLIGLVSMILMLVSGVSGPLIDTFFLNGGYDRKQVIATKAVCQVFSHLAKGLYFGGLIDQAASIDLWLIGAAIVSTIIGSSLAKPVVERISESQFRTWASRIIMIIATLYILKGLQQIIFAS